MISSICFPCCTAAAPIFSVFKHIGSCRGLTNIVSMYFSIDLILKWLIWRPSRSTIHSPLHGSPLNHNLISWNNSNGQSESLVLVAQSCHGGRGNRKVASKRAMKTEAVTCVKSYVHTILIMAKTNSGGQSWAIMKAKQGHHQLQL